jgi:hypothetical protein
VSGIKPSWGYSELISQTVSVLCCAVLDLPYLVWVTLADRLGGEEKRVLSKWSGHGGVGLGSVECTLLALRPLPLVLIPFMAGGGWGSSI